MCGIVGYTGYRNAVEVLLEGLSKLEYRGYDSAGIAVNERGQIQVDPAMGRLDALRQKLADHPLPACGCGIGHTRWATHGAPSDVNSHPHSGGRVCIVHNGIIENYAHLKENLARTGYPFESDTDTEVLAKLLDSCYKDDPLAALHEMASRVRGSYALAVLFRDLPDTVFAVRKESPLIVGYGQGENFVASDIPALLRYTRQYSVLDEGEVAVLQPGGVCVYNEFGHVIQKERLTVDWDLEAAEKGGYPHFMLKEIHEQPRAIAATVNPRVQDGLPCLGLETITDNYLRGVRSVQFVACGTAMHAGMVGRALVEQLARVPAVVDIASEFRYRDPIVGPEDLVVIISQSGETSDTLAALRLARQKGARVLAVVNVVGSSIAREADEVLYTYAGPEIAVASTKAYSVQLCAMYLLALRMALARGARSEQEVRDLTAELQKMGERQQALLEHCDRVQYLASQFMNSEDLFFMGRGLDYALSLEASLKLKEISYIHSDAYAAGELKHGTISLVVTGTPVVALATQRAVSAKTLSNVREARSRGARVILLCREDTAVPDDAADHLLRLPDCPDLLMPLQLIVPLQLFAYYTSVLRGCDVDKPRNLAKSVTVE